MEKQNLTDCHSDPTREEKTKERKVHCKTLLKSSSLALV